MKKLKECGGFFFFNNLIATNGFGLNGRFNAVLARVIRCLF